MMGLSDDAVVNWQQQVDEVQALEAIYGDSFRVLEASGIFSSAPCKDGRRGSDGSPKSSSSGAEPLRQQQPLDAESLAQLDAPHKSAWELHCSLMVVVEPPGGSLHLLLPAQQPQQEQHEQDVANGPISSSAAHANGNGSAAQDSDKAARVSYTVQCLPPICLQLRLGEGYPSEQPPGVSLSALWLSGGQGAQLERQLLHLWHEQGPGAPVCYSWAEWLQRSALQHMGAEYTLLLADDLPSGSAISATEQQGQQRTGEPGGSSSGRPASTGWEEDEGEAQQRLAEDRLVKLLRYNAVQEHAAFQQGLHTCGVCLEEQPGRLFVRLDGCRHAWCKACLGAQARIHVAEGGLEKLRCPDPCCGAPLLPSVLRRVLLDNEYARWEQLTLQRTLDTMPDAAYCPRCSTISLEDTDCCTQCPRCNFVFCSLCNEGWHPGTTCVSAGTKLAMLRRKMEGGGRAALEDLRRQEQDLLSLAQIEKSSKRCPCCGTATQKAEGCNKMACGGCGAYWCWRCNKEIDGYRHFRSGECILFDEAEILRWELQWEEMQAAVREVAAGMRNELIGETAGRAGTRLRGCLCPQCGQGNHKVGNNNLIACWSCTSRFCYCCRAVLRGRGAGGTHFGPRGCKQHSPD